MDTRLIPDESGSVEGLCESFLTDADIEHTNVSISEETDVLAPPAVMQGTRAAAAR
jgi:hypothetical protein